jgi:integrase
MRVVPRRLGAPPRNREHHLLRRQAKLDLPRLTLKGLRHTWATIALEQGIHHKVVQERLGHSTINITIDIYSHVSPTMHDDAANLVAGLIVGPIQPCDP